MKTIKTNTPLKDLKGEVLKERETTVTIGLLLSNLLSTLQTTNPHLAYQFAKKFATDKEVELKAEDVVFIKAHIQKSDLGSLYIGQAIDILEASDK